MADLFPRLMDGPHVQATNCPPAQPHVAPVGGPQPAYSTERHMTLSFHALAPALADAGQPEVWSGALSGLISALALILNLVGIAVIVWGAYGSVVRLIGAGTAAVRGQGPAAEGPPVRLAFVPY